MQNKNLIMSEHQTGKRDFFKFKQENEKQIIINFGKKGNSNCPIILTDDLLFKNEQFVVSPSVFCKKVPSSFFEGVSSRLIIFENLLRIVCQAYYKSEFTIGNLIQEIETKSKSLKLLMLSKACTTFSYSHLLFFIIIKIECFI